MSQGPDLRLVNRILKLEVIATTKEMQHKKWPSPLVKKATLT